MNNILITGTNRGIGLGLVKAFLKLNKPPSTIITTCRKPEVAAELKELADKHPNIIHILKFDVVDFPSYPGFLQCVTDITKDQGINLLVNNAGVAGKFLRIGYLKHDAMKETFLTNTIAPIMLVKNFIPLLKKAARCDDESSENASAAVVNITSIMGSIAQNDSGGYYPYRCSKAALNAATKSLSLDLKEYNIIAVAIHPGWVKTEMGGANAPMEINDACCQIVNTISQLKKNSTGGFYNYDGNTIPW